LGTKKKAWKPGPFYERRESLLGAKEEKRGNNCVEKSQKVWKEEAGRVWVYELRRTHALNLRGGEGFREIFLVKRGRARQLRESKKEPTPEAVTKKSQDNQKSPQQLRCSFSRAKIKT